MAEILHIQRKKNYPINQSFKQSINQNSNYKFLRYVFFQLYPFSSHRKISRNIAVLYPELKKIKPGHLTDSRCYRLEER